MLAIGAGVTSLLQALLEKEYEEKRGKRGGCESETGHSEQVVRDHLPRTTGAEQGKTHIAGPQ